MTPARPIPSSKSTPSSTSSTKSRIPDKIFDDTPQSKSKASERSLSPITPPAEPAPTYAISKRLPIRRRSASATIQVRDSISTFEEIESCGDEDVPSPTPMPKGRHRPAELRVSASNAGGSGEAQRAITKSFEIATSSRRRSAETSKKPKDSVQTVRRRQSLLSDEGTRAQDRELTSTLEIPGAYQSFSTQGSRPSPSCLSGSSSESTSDTDVIKMALPPRKPPSRRKKSEPRVETEDDAEERPSRSQKQLRPDFEPFRSKGGARPPKDRRSINFEILNCIKTASKKKNKSAPNANLGSIYVFESPEHAPDHLKVGKSNRDPMKRKGEWEKCGVTLIEVEDTDRNCFDHYDIVELLLQTELQNLRRMYKCSVCGRKHNEWFEADKWTVLEVIDRWRTWIKEEQPFDEDWNLTAYWQWRVERAKVSVSDVRWDDWTHSSIGDRFHHDFLKPYRERKDDRFQVVGTLLVFLMWINYGGNCAVLTFVGLLLL